MRYLTLLLALCLLGAMTLLPSDSGEATVQFTTEHGMLLVQGFYASGEEQEEEALAYILEVVRDGTAGLSTTRQRGAFISTPGQVDTLSTSQVSVGEGDQVEATLTVSRDDETIAREIVRCTYPACGEPVDRGSSQ